MKLRFQREQRSIDIRFSSKGRAVWLIQQFVLFLREFDDERDEVIGRWYFRDEYYYGDQDLETLDERLTS